MPNLFKELLENDIFLNEKELKEQKSQKETTNYIPRESTLLKLTESNKELIEFINRFNPFKENLESTLFTAHRDTPKVFKKLFPLDRAIVSKLNEEGRELVLEKWQEGIEKSFTEFRDDLVDEKYQDIDADSLIYVFMDSILELTHVVVFENHHYVRDILFEALLRASEISENINEDTKILIRTHYQDIVSKENIAEEHIESYRKTKYKILDTLLDRALIGNAFVDACLVFSQIDNYLRLTGRDKKEVITKAEKIVDALYTNLQQSKVDYEEIMQLKNLPEYKNGTYKEKEDINKKVRRTNLDFYKKRNALKSALNALAKL